MNWETFVRHGLVSGVVVWALSWAAAATGAVTISEPSPATVALPSGGSGAAELSGLSWNPSGTWYFVGDSSATLYHGTMTIDPVTGQISSPQINGSVALSAGSDLEGLAFDPVGGDVLVSDEVGPAIRRHRVSDGGLLGTFTVPAVFSGAVGNRSLESLTRRVGGGGEIWTANEEALTADGPLSTALAGTTVRLQRFDAAGNPNGQWAYVTDPIPGPNAPFALGQSGVADLAALPTGQLLVLERGFDINISPAFVNAIYRVDTSGATDTSALPSLSGGGFTAVSKTLLWTRAFVLDNFEGLAIGPTLGNGDLSLVLVSDDQSGTFMQSLFALRISGVALPVPALAPLGAFGLAVALVLFAWWRLALASQRD